MSRGSTSCSIFVGNVPYDAEEGELREIFSRVGNVSSIRVVTDRETNQPKGYAFCDFSDPESVKEAIEKLNNVEYKGRKIRVDWAERELRGSGPSGGPRALGDRDRDRDDGPAPGPPVRRGPPTIDPSTLPPVPTYQDRLAMLRDQEAQEKARIAAAENAERGEIGRLMETLTPQQVLHILGEMQRLTVRAPEVARALLAENMQLALAVHHAQFLAGMIDDPPLSTEPEVKERARSVREKIWGGPNAPAPPHPSIAAAAAAQAGQQALMALPAGAVMLPAGATMLPFGAVAVPQTVGFVQVAGPPPVLPSAVPAEPPPIAPEVLSQVLDSAAMDEATRAPLMERLMQLSPAEIDRLPQHSKLQLLEFLQKLPPKS